MLIVLILSPKVGPSFFFRSFRTFTYLSSPNEGFFLRPTKNDGFFFAKIEVLDSQ